ncbi:ClpX C4-type zinc finger protein [Nisaea nitritireducens]|uniref:ClpX C4-type zinc finger protein n=1 Tax=Nisaea nitritireducens TaxID=568392 RepID=UPI001868D869|nr:ClpX C4-type zinc finger protein [Nisaea nitritireducens]
MADKAKPTRPSVCRQPHRTCSFCGAKANDVRYMVTGASPTVSICNDCVAFAYVEITHTITRDTNTAAQVLQGGGS